MGYFGHLKGLALGGGGGHHGGGHHGGGHRVGGGGFRGRGGYPYPVSYDTGPYVVIENVGGSATVQILDAGAWRTVADGVAIDQADTIAATWRAKGYQVRIL